MSEVPLPFSSNRVQGAFELKDIFLSMTGGYCYASWVEDVSDLPEPSNVTAFDARGIPGDSVVKPGTQDLAGNVTWRMSSWLASHLHPKQPRSQSKGILVTGLSCPGWSTPSYRKT